MTTSSHRRPKTVQNGCYTIGFDNLPHNWFLTYNLSATHSLSSWWQGIFVSTRFVEIGHPRLESFVFSARVFDGSINQGARLLGFNGVFRDSFRRITGRFPNEIRPNDRFIKRYTKLYKTIHYDIMVHHGLHSLWSLWRYVWRRWRIEQLGLLFSIGSHRWPKTVQNGCYIIGFDNFPHTWFLTYNWSHSLISWWQGIFGSRRVVGIFHPRASLASLIAHSG